MTSRLVGTGRYVPPFEYDSSFMSDFAGSPRGWDGNKVERMTGIKARRFAVRLNNNTGLPVNKKKDLGQKEIEMAENAAWRALDASGYEPGQVDMLILVSCTTQRGVRQHFASSAHELHRRLELRPDATVDEMDAGCGGAVHAIERATERIESGRRHVALIVASNMPSQYMDRELYLKTNSWLSSLIFGDGAAAVVLDNHANSSRLLGSVTRVDGNLELMQLRGDPHDDPDLAYYIHGAEVKNAFGSCLGPALNMLFERAPEAKRADLFILHQVNQRVLESFVKDFGLPYERVPVHVDIRGNIAAAATLDILDEKRRSQHVGDGSVVVLGAVGAGAQAGAVAFRL